jgi:hypothetical protein
MRKPKANIGIEKGLKRRINYVVVEIVPTLS